VFSTLLFHQLIPPREVLRSNLAPDRQYQRTTTTIAYFKLQRIARSLFHNSIQAKKHCKMYCH